MAKAAIKKAEPELVVYDFDQGTPEWINARLGLATASEFSSILAGSEEKKGRTTLLRKLAGEIICGHPMENFTSKAMERGTVQEAEARDWYARTNFVEVQQVGFVFNPAVNAGWSPDGLVGDVGAVEIKSAAAHILIEILERGTFPGIHRAQCHGGLWVGRRQWIDLVIYCHPKMPKFVCRLEKDPVYEKEISDAIEVFNWDLKKLVEKLRAMQR